MKTIKILSYIFGALVLVSSCKKETDLQDQSAPFTLRMTDAPGDYSAVYIDLQAVKITDEAGQSYYVNAKPGRYNLVELVNGKDALIADGVVKGERMSKITFFLGTNNVVEEGPVSHQLQLRNFEEGFTIAIDKKIAVDKNDLIVDFDIAKSIKTSGSDFFLEPVIRLIDVEATGAIKGRLKKRDAVASITATGPDGTFTTFTSVGECDHHNSHGHGHHGYHDGNWDGWDDDDDDDHGNGNGHGHGHGHHSHNSFFMPALPPGTYTLTVVGRDPYNTTVTLSNIQVTAGEVTNVGKIEL